MNGARGFSEAELRVLAAADQVEESTDGMTDSERNCHHSLMSRLRRLEREGDAFRRLRSDQMKRSQRARSR